MKKFVIQVGYSRYSVEQTDAATLLDIASRMKPVKQVGYSGPYFIQPDEEPPFTTLSIEDVEEQPKEDGPDKFSAATRDTIAF